MDPKERQSDTQHAPPPEAGFNEDNSDSNDTDPPDCFESFMKSIQRRAAGEDTDDKSIIITVHAMPKPGAWPRLFDNTQHSKQDNHEEPVTALGAAVDVSVGLEHADVDEAEAVRDAEDEFLDLEEDSDSEHHYLKPIVERLIFGGDSETESEVGQGDVAHEAGHDVLIAEAHALVMDEDEEDAPPPALPGLDQPLPAGHLPNDEDLPGIRFNADDNIAEMIRNFAIQHLDFFADDEAMAAAPPPVGDAAGAANGEDDPMAQNNLFPMENQILFFPEFINDIGHDEEERMAIINFNASLDNFFNNRIEQGRPQNIALGRDLIEFLHIFEGDAH